MRAASDCAADRDVLVRLEKRNDRYRVVFLYAGRRHGYPLGTGAAKKAGTLTKGVEALLQLPEQGYKHLPPRAALDAPGIVLYIARRPKPTPSCPPGVPSRPRHALPTRAEWLATAFANPDHPEA